LYLAEFTGRGVRVAIVDSGVHAGHPHIGGIAGGFGLRNGAVIEDCVDRLGHGTAVAAAVREKAPAAELLAVKVFFQTLATDVDTLARAIVEAAGKGAGVINLSLGTAEIGHRARLEDAILCARRDGAIVVGARHDSGVSWLPGSLDGVAAVRSDPSLDRGTYDVRMVNDRPVIVTAPYPRAIPGVPRERNLNGISFAVANASGFVARAREASPRADVGAILTRLREEACARIA
jgi:hypothetical protein